MKYVIAYDIGTTGVKTCLFAIDKTITLLTSAHQGYGLYLLDNGGAEQDVDEWWQAMADTTHQLFTKSDVKPSDIAGISFCSQMQGLVLVDKEGNALRPAMSYMDQRSKQELKDGMGGGLEIEGANIFKLLKSLRITKAASLSVKDPLWKYKWVENNEPEIFKKIHKWLDVKEYLIARLTGRFIMTPDSAYSTFLYDTRKGHEGWSKSLCRTFGVNMDHLPEIIKATDIVGGLTSKAAKDLGLTDGTPVFGGGGDATLIGLGAGAVNVGETHIYSGTSGWVSTILDKQVVDVSSMIASIVAVEEKRFNYFAEMETAGKSLEWVKDHLALDEIGIYLEKKDITFDKEKIYTSLYDYLTETVKKAEPGSGGVIFTPWLHGNRCPFEDPNAAGMFFNIRLETGKTELIRAVLEGICFHLRWMLECQDKKIKTSQTIRFVGGGALSKVTNQMLADITGRTIEVVENPQNVGAVGAAAVIGVGLGVIEDIKQIKDYIPINDTYISNPQHKEAYDKNYFVFKKIYKSNKNLFKELNGMKEKKPVDQEERKKDLIRAFKFFLFSVSAGIIEFGSFTVLDLTLGGVWGWWPSYLIALVLSVLWNFTFNRRFTFQSAANIPFAMFLVFLFYAVFAPTSTLLGNHLEDTLKWNGFLVLAIVMVLNFVLEFLYQRFVVFRKSLDTNKQAKAKLAKEAEQDNHELKE